MNQLSEKSADSGLYSSCGQGEDLEERGVAITIPEMLKIQKQWVAWKSVPRLDGKKPTKVPVDVRTERGAQANNSRTWAPFHDVMEYISEWSGEDHTHIDGSGVEITGTVSEFPGYFFSADDPFCGIDLDDCRNPDTGDVAPWALEIIEHFNSCTELSQSGTGFHIIIKGQKPAGSRSRKGGIECYDRDRYFITTGNIYQGFDVINDRQVELEIFLNTYLAPVDTTNPLLDKTSNSKLPSHADVKKVLDRALRSQKCLKIKALLEGKTAGLPSDSEGDISLCNYLVFFCGNMVEKDVYRIVDEIFRNSKRMRPKWDKIHRPADGATYGQMTIEQAIKGTQDRYQTIDKLDVAAQDEETPLWSFEDAEIHIEKQKGRSLSNSQKIVLSQDVLEHSDFGPIEEALIKDLLKKVTGINKTAMDRFKKDRLGNGKATADSLTHSELSAHFIAAELPEDPTKSTACEGKIWVYNDDSGIFEAMPLTEVEIKVGDNYQTKYCKRGSDYKSIAILVHNRVLDEDFFKNAPRGLPGETAFFCVDNTGSISRKEYEPTLRQRFKLGCDPDSNCVTPIFSTFMNDSFPKNQNQQDLIQEIFGAMLTGLSSKLQTAFFLYGAGANGKSVLLEILDGLVSRELKCSVKPDMFGNEYYRAELAGKLINIVGEVDKDKQITADFKDVVGCDVPVTARMPYERPFRFTPLCGHFFAGNGFPQTRDHSMGFYRRWRFVYFKNIVPEGKRIPALAKKILATETPGILFWALDGAKRLIKNDYKLTTTTENKALIAQWQLSGDSVEAFLNDETYVQIHPSVSCEKEHAFEAYRHYCSFAGVRYIGLHNFYQRIGTRFRERKKPHEKRTFEGFDVLYSR
jgi:P4 family phage/plasmid primase-like protien